MTRQRLYSLRTPLLLRALRDLRARTLATSSQVNRPSLQTSDPTLILHHFLVLRHTILIEGLIPIGFRRLIIRFKNILLVGHSIRKILRIQIPLSRNVQGVRKRVGMNGLPLDRVG